MSAGMRLQLVVLFGVSLAMHGATYYIDSSRGQDSNPGTSEKAPWRSLAKVNAASFRPGDRVLFKSGATWKGQLAPKSSGSEGAPIIIDRYGSGPKPKIDGEGHV